MEKGIELICLKDIGLKKFYRLFLIHIHTKGHLRDCLECHQHY